MGPQYDLLVKCRLVEPIVGIPLVHNSFISGVAAGSMWVADADDKTKRLIVVTPNNRIWDLDVTDDVDGQQKTTWIKTGEPPDASVVGARNGGPGSYGWPPGVASEYHALLWQGDLVNVERAREPSEFARLPANQQAFLCERLPLSFPPPHGALGQMVTMILHSPSGAVCGPYAGRSDGIVRLDGVEIDTNQRYVRAFLGTDWWERDARPNT